LSIDNSKKILSPFRMFKSRGYKLIQLFISWLIKICYGLAIVFYFIPLICFFIIVSICFFVVFKDVFMIFMLLLEPLLFFKVFLAFLVFLI